MYRSTIIAVGFFLIAGAASAETMFTLANTFQDPKLTGGQEISTTSFDANVYGNESATVRDGVELPNFVNFYSIDVSVDMSTLTMTVSDSAKPFNNPMPADRFDRYYFTFTGAAPTTATIDFDGSTAAIANGAKVGVISTGRLVVEFSEGADFTSGNKVVVKLN